MKTFKTLILFTGIIIGIIALIHSPVKADNKKGKSTKIEDKASLNFTEIMETESILLDNYLQIQALSKPMETIRIVNQEGETVFTGAKNEAEDLINKSTFLFKNNNEAHYLVVK